MHKKTGKGSEDGKESGRKEGKERET